MPTPRTEPPFAADEPTTLRSFLDYYRATLRREYDEAVAAWDAHLDAALAAGDLDQPCAYARPRDGARPNLRYVLVHMVEEYARHAGHADLLRQSVDGATDL